MKFLAAFTLALLVSIPAAYSDMNNVEATRLLAEQGDPYSQLYLAFMYEKGKGIPEDKAEAFNWYKKAADQGMPAGQSSLGEMYAKGIVVPQNHLAAYIYFYMAAVQSHGGARESRDEVAVNLSAEQLDRGQKLAIQCVESGYTDCKLD